MKLEGDATFQEQLVLLLAACDDAVATGQPADSVVAADAPPELRARLEREVAWCRMVRRLLPEAGSRTSDTPGLAATMPNPVAVSLGRFRIRRELGRGGFGVVFLAYDPKLGREVALKVPRPEAIVHTELRARFEQEARAAAGLDHPNLVPVYEAGNEGAICYIASAYCPGVTLTAWLRERTEPVPFAVAAGLIATLARAVEHAHRRGILHRDLKPSNVMLSPGPAEADSANIAAQLLEFTPRIMDFGLAKLVEGEPGATLLAYQTQSGAIVGTPSYMAPEQAGDNQKIGPATDVYALGAILYELLTGRPPFQAGSLVDTLLMVREKEPMPPTRLRLEVPRDLETICLTCLHKEPSKRYPTAQALADDLTRFLEDRPIEARPVGRLERAWRWCRRNPVLASLLAVVALLLLAVAITSTVSALRLQTALTTTEKAGREARLREAEALLGQARGISYSRRPGQRFKALEAITKAVAIGRELEQPPDWFDPFRNVAITALALSDLDVTHSWPGFPPGTLFAELSEDFELYGRSTAKGACSIRRVADDTEVAQLPELGEPAHIQFGPGRLLCRRAVSSSRFQLWDLSGPIPNLRLEDRGVHPVWSFRALDQVLAIPHGDGTVVIHDKDRGTLHSWKGPPIAEQQLALHPCQPLVAIFSYRSNFLEVRSLTGELLAREALPWATNSFAAWSPDGHTLAVSEGDGGRILLFAVTENPPILHRGRLLQVASSGGMMLQFNPAGDRLAVHDWKQRVHLFDTNSGQLLFSHPPVPDITCPGFPLRFDASGKRLAATRVGRDQERIGLWAVSDCRESWKLGVPQPVAWGVYYGRPAIHPGGRLAAQGVMNDLVLSDLETGRELARLHVPGQNGGVCFDKAGNLWSNGQEGLLRWPIQAHLSRPGHWLIGSPGRLPFQRGVNMIAVSHDGRVVAQSMFGGYRMEKFAGGWILAGNRGRPQIVDRGQGKQWCSVSPDGRLVAFCGPRGGGLNSVKVFDAVTGRDVWESPRGEGFYHVYGNFSSDGRWLLTDLGGGQAHAVGTWQTGPRLGPGCPWDLSPDGRLAVVGLPDGVYRLVERETGREVARLEDPDQLPGPAVFTPDGTRLVISTESGLRVWNLRRIRTELCKLGLDWDEPDYPDADPAASGLLEVTILTPEEQRAQAVFELYVNPFDANAHLQLGTLQVEAGQVEAGSPHLMVALALRADLPYVQSSRTVEAFRKAVPIFVGQRRWPAATAALEQLVRTAPEDSERIMQLAAAYLAADDRASYERTCSAMITRFRDSKNPSDLERTVKMCLIAADLPDRRDELGRMARLAVQRGQNRNLRFFQFAQGMYEYRRGECRVAVDWFDQCATSPFAQGETSLEALNGIFAAMAHYKLGDRQEAGRLLSSAEGIVQRGYDAALETGSDVWHDWLFCRLALDEARKLLGQTGQP